MTTSSASGHQPKYGQVGTKTYKIITQYGDMLVVKQGIHTSHAHGHHHHHYQHQQQHQSPSKSSSQHQQQTRPIIMTFHDLGLNSELQFANFCECDEVKLMLQTFTMIHVNFIGQEMAHGSSGGGGGGKGSNRLPADYTYPNVEQMAECIVDVCTQLRVRSFIALAVGAGAYIVSTLALMRPDLVDGLFLINPIVSGCSITEWLYFKMSAIASNHQIGDHGKQRGDSSDSPKGSGRNRKSHSPSPNSSPGRASHSSSPSGSGSGSSGLRKLLNAAHIHLPHSHHNIQKQQHHHHQHHHHHHHRSNSHHSNHKEQQPAEAKDQRAEAEEDAADDTKSVSQISTCSAVSSTNSSTGSTATHPASSRLRRLIMSRNFRLGGGQNLHNQRVEQQQQQRRQAAEDTAANQSQQQQSATPEMVTTTTSGERKGSRGSAHSNESIGGAGPSKSSGRPPLEYLMYHHFGPSAFHRYTRRSSAGGTATGSGSTSAAGSESVATTPTKVAVGSGAKRASGTPSDELVSRSHDSLATSAGVESASTGSETGNTSGQVRARSNSLCLDAVHMASLPSERQRLAYARSAYKQYFGQLNEYNLWLFAQSFVKRQALNLRKDCGAAAHAAAAAAALGTSICSAFVGLAPAQPAGGNQAAASAGNKQRAGAGGGELGVAQPDQQSAQQQDHAAVEHGLSFRQQQVASSKQQPQQALVAGTKVKRTFTCQTLIMCSSVQIHCERAFKLMSLLNPLQATWIKTDQLLVLEEKPEKVCQALRLFLQGIGYSMSTYERQLRLCHSAHNSADSNDSMRSLDNSRASNS